MKKKGTESQARAILLGPSVEIPKSRRQTWVRARLRQLKLGTRDFKIGVDGGVEFWSAVKLVPELAVGDWDSLSAGSLASLKRSHAQLITLPRKKNESDLAAALRNTPPCEEVLLIGFTGGRPDHHLSNLLEIARFASSLGVGPGAPKKIAAIGPEAEYHFITARQPEFSIQRPRGTLISVFALGEAAEGVMMNGFEYNLRGQRLVPSSRGLSNRIRASQKPASLRLRRGVLVMVIPRAK